MKKLIEIFNLFSKKQKRKLFLLAALILLGMFAEVFSIGAILPIMTILSDDESLANYPIILSFFSFLDDPSLEIIFVTGFLILGAVFVVRSLLLAYIAFYQNSYTFDIYQSFSRKLYDAYLHLPYEEHIQRNSAEMIRNISTEVNLFSELVRAAINISAEFFVLLGILSLLFFVDPMSLCIIFLCFALTCIPYFLFLKDHINRWGALRHYHDGKKTQWLTEGLSTIKYILISNQRDSFLDGFSTHVKKAAHNARNQKIFQEFPRLILESVGVIALGIMSAVLIFQGKLIAEIFPIIAIFSFAAFRIMPSVNRMLVGLQTFRYAVPVMDIMLKEFSHPQLKFNSIQLSHPVNRFKEIQEILFKDIFYSYPLSDESQLKGVSVAIANGQFIGIVGKSGSGKSTFLDILLGLLQQESGDIIINGQATSFNVDKWNSNIGYVPQEIILTDNSLKNNIAFGVLESDIDLIKIQSAISLSNLNEVVEQLDEGIDSNIGEKGVRLSGGQIQRIGIARALYNQPDIIVFDEATSALDRQTELEVLDAIASLRGMKTIIMITHRIETAERCDYVYKFDQGAVVSEGKPGALNLG
jgi:ATP-binding cassette, subfamily B, bacterial PglK